MNLLDRRDRRWQDFVFVFSGQVCDEESSVRNKWRRQLKHQISGRQTRKAKEHLLVVWCQKKVEKISVIIFHLLYVLSFQGKKIQLNIKSLWGINHIYSQSFLALCQKSMGVFFHQLLKLLLTEAEADKMFIWQKRIQQILNFHIFLLIFYWPHS